jgi:Recombination endonuclease VII
MALTRNEISKRYRDRHLEEQREKSRAYAAKLRAENPEKVKEAQAKWRAANREAIAEKKRQAYLADPERFRAASRASREKHKDSVNAKQKARWQDPAFRARERARMRLLMTGWTPEAYEAASVAQGGLCAICGQESKLMADHCHATKRPRALLCVLCNTGLGAFRDSKDLMTKAIAYLAEHRGPDV